jgi:signal transduction histidine kinase
MMTAGFPGRRLFRVRVGIPRAIVMDGMDSDQPQLFARYRELQRSVGWTEEDASRLQSVGGRIRPAFDALVDDFYAEIARQPASRRILTGGKAQVERLKQTLRRWIEELFTGQYDESYVQGRWRVGLRHVEIGLEPARCSVAMARIRSGLVREVHRALAGDPEAIEKTSTALSKLLDLDLAIIGEAYQTEHLARCQQIERLATLGQIAGGIAHELRNPLNVIRTSVYYLLNARIPSDQKRFEHLRRIERQVDLADSVISALANFARLPMPEVRPFSLEACVLETIDLLTFPQGIEVVVSGLAGLPKIAADSSQIQIVLSNLIRNAVEAMPQGGRVTIEGRQRGQHVELAVSDTGPGIEPNQIPRIFEPFVTSKPRGLGLGLAISRTIVDKNRGEMRVSSTLGEGSCFVIRLNSASAASGALADNESPREGASGSGG